MRRLRILHAIHDFLPRHRAGSEIYAADLATALARRHDVWVLAAEYDPATPHGQLRWRAHEAIPVVEIVNNWAFRDFGETWSSPRVNRQLEHVLHAVQPDIVHVHNLLNLSFDLPRLSLERGARPVATLHDYTLFCPSGGQRVHVAESHVCHTIDPERCARCFDRSPFAAQLTAGGTLGGGALLKAAGRLARRYPLISRAMIAGASRTDVSDIRYRLASTRSVLDTFDVMVAPSRAIAAEYVRLGAQPERIEVSGYGLRAHAVARTRTPGEHLRIGFVGTPIWHKGVHVLIDATRRLHGGFQVVVYGDLDIAPDYTQRLRADASGLPVAFAGPFGREQVGQVFDGLDVLVVPSLWPENAPFVIQEARAHGVAVAGSRIGGIPEFVRDGIDGALFEPGSADDLARVLQAWIDAPAMLAGIEAVAPKSIEQDAAEWEERYERVLTRVLPIPTVAARA